MMRMHYAGPIGLFIFLFLAALPSNEVSAQVPRFAINPGGQYTYLPSPEGPGIPGGMPSAFELDFGVSGLFSIEFGDMTARFLDVDLTLLGNEAVQSNPPGLALVTADRVGSWLEERRFNQLPVAGPFDVYADEMFPSLMLTDFLNGMVLLDGGFDFRRVDGNGVDFTLSATIIPEPAGCLLACLAIAALVPLLLGRAKFDLATPPNA